MMRRLRVLVMMDEALVPPEAAERMSAQEIETFKTEYHVLTALRVLGHEVESVGIKSDLAVLSKAIKELRPHICFNLVEDFDGIPNRDQHVVSYLELINQPYTGCNPRGLTLTRDKALCKKILSYDGIQVPRFAEFPLGRSIKLPKAFVLPALVKSLGEEGSVGISQASIVRNPDELLARISFLHEKHRTHVIAEQYIDGRELYVSVIGNRRPETFPIWELCLEHLPANASPIATAKVKWDEQYRRRHRIISREARDLPPMLRRRIHELAREIYTLLDMSGYARIDLRLTDDGEIYFLEANPNPQIAREEDFADSAAAAGFDYTSLLQRILNLGLSYQPLRLAA